MAKENMYLDKRLQEKGLREGVYDTKFLDEHLSGLPDVADNVVEFDEEGNPSNLPERELNELPIKGVPEAPPAEETLEEAILDVLK